MENEKIRKYRVKGEFGIRIKKRVLAKIIPVNEIVTADGFMQAKNYVLAKLENYCLKNYGAMAKYFKKSDLEISLVES